MKRAGFWSMMCACLLATSASCVVFIATDFDVATSLLIVGNFILVVWNAYYAGCRDSLNEREDA